VNKKELNNIVKYKNIISKETMIGFINHIEREINFMKSEIKQKSHVLKKLKKTNEN
jgi:hypothetical protein